jgi:protein TonB
MTVPNDVSASPLLSKRHSVDIFVCTIVISLLLHLAAAVFLSLPGRNTPPGSPPLFVDLQNLPEAPPAALNPAEKALAPPPEQTPSPEPAPQQGAEPSPEAAKLERAVESSLRRAVQTPDAVHESAIGLGMTSGHFASFAEGATLKDDIRVYYFDLMRRINEAWWMSGAARGTFANPAAVNIAISREGKLLGCELLESSGNREQDRAILAAVKAAEPLPPLPKSYLWPTFNAPIRFVPPLRLMFPGFGDKNKPMLKHGER